MPYVERVVVAGLVRETRKMYTGRIHTQGATRGKPEKKTDKAQEKVNERKVEEIIRWRLNANFRFGDLHLVLHYYDKAVELERAEQDKKDFLALLRRYCKREGIPWKYLAVTETKRMTNVHHHVIMPDVPMQDLFALWERVVGAGNGNISSKPMDRRGNHEKLANYLTKESRSTAERYRKLGKRYKRFTCAQGMEAPEPEYTIIQSDTWAKAPRPTRDYTLLKDDDGNTTRTGIHEWSGWPWMEYKELWIGAEPPPRPRHRLRQ